MPTVVRFSIDVNLDGGYAITVDSNSQVVWLHVPAESDLVFAQTLYDKDSKIKELVRTVDAQTFARKLAKLYRGKKIPTTVSSD